MQIVGGELCATAEAARDAQDLGASMIDINMGCPAKKVTDGYAGSDPTRDLGLAALIRAAVATVQIPATLKVRLGWDEQSINARKLARLSEAEGIAVLFVRQFYAAMADWRAIGIIKQADSIPVAANGDCQSLADAGAMLAQSGADAAMIGVPRWASHGSLATWPIIFIIKKPAPPPPSPLLEIHRTGQGLRHPRKHLAAYAERAGTRNCAELHKRLVGLDCPKGFRSTLCELFDSPLKMEAA